LGDFLQNILGGKNTFSAQPMQLDKTDYNQSIDAAQKAAIAGLNVPTETGKMQTDLAQQLMAQSQGQGPSLAQMQLQQASDQNLKNQAGLIASQRGMNPAQAARAVALQGASQGQNLANQSAQLRLNEQLQKQQLLQQALQGQRGLDINQLQANTGLLSTSGQLAGSQSQRDLENYWNAQKINAGIAEQNAKGASALGGGLLSAGASILAGPAKNALSGLFGGGGGASGFSMPELGSGAGFGGGRGAEIGSALQSSADLTPVSPGAQFGQPVGRQNYKLFANGGMVGYSDGGAIEQDSPNPEMSRVLVSPGEKVVNPDGAVMKVPGKAKYQGDNEKNDTVIADLRKDAVVIPRSKSGDKEKMIEFLKHVKESSKKKSDLQQLLDSHNEIKQKLDDLQYKMGKYSPK
jgi:hypothetical protein